MNIFKSSSVSDTARLASCFARAGLKGAVVFLAGPIGSGKTVFVQAVASALGMRELPASASFAIARSYRGGGNRLYHFDLFRLKEQDLRECGHEQALSDEEGVIAVEWPGPAGDYFPQDRLELEFRLLPGGGREIRAGARGPASAGLLEKAGRLWLKKNR